MLRSLNLHRSIYKINNLILYNNKYAAYCLYSTQIENRQNWSNFSISRYIPNKIEYHSNVLSALRYKSTDSNSRKCLSEKQSDGNTVVVTRKERFKKAIKEYGATVIVFHVFISLISLGICYTIVSAGLDVESFFIQLGFTEEVTAKLATKTGTFVAAYAFHKIFAPVRISITLAATPFIVKYLRKVGWLKKPPPKQIKLKTDKVKDNNRSIK